MRRRLTPLLVDARILMFESDPEPHLLGAIGSCLGRATGPSTDRLVE